MVKPRPRPAGGLALQPDQKIQRTALAVNVTTVHLITICTAAWYSVCGVGCAPTSSSRRAASRCPKSFITNSPTSLARISCEKGWLKHAEHSFTLAQDIAIRSLMMLVSSAHAIALQHRTTAVHFKCRVLKISRHTVESKLQSRRDDERETDRPSIDFSAGGTISGA